MLNSCARCGSGDTPATDERMSWHPKLTRQLRSVLEPPVATSAGLRRLTSARRRYGLRSVRDAADDCEPTVHDVVRYAFAIPSREPVYGPSFCLLEKRSTCQG